MDKEFVKTSLRNLIPITIVLSFLFWAGHLSSDYYFHLNNSGPYPPMLQYLLALSANRSLALFGLNLLFSTLVPYLLIVRITQKELAGFVYLYGTGIPIVLFILWVVPQSILQCVMLATIAFDWGIWLFLLGPVIHEFWYAGLAITVAYGFAKKKGWLNGP